MPWYASTIEHFAVTPVRPAPPERVDVRRARRRDRDAVRDQVNDKASTRSS